MRTSGGLSALLGVLLRSRVCRVWACPRGPWAPIRTREIRVGAPSPVHFWAVPGSAPSAPPPSPNFLPTFRTATLGAPLRFPHELFSSARSNQRAPAPQAEPGLGAAPPAPARPSLLRQAPPGPVPAPASPTRRSCPVPQSPSRSGFHPPRRRGAQSAPQREQRHSREGARKRETGPPPASWGGTPRPRRDPDSSHVSLCSRPARPLRGRPPPARAVGTRGHTWAPPPGARRARMGLR